MKTTINEEKLADKIDADDKKKIMDAIEDALKWMEANQLAEKEEFDHKLKEIEKICSPIITKLYGGAGGPGGMPGGMPGGFPGAGGAQPGGAGGSTGPTIEEVD